MEGTLRACPHVSGAVLSGSATSRGVPCPFMQGLCVTLGPPDGTTAQRKEGRYRWARHVRLCQLACLHRHKILLIIQVSRFRGNRRRAGEAPPRAMELEGAGPGSSHGQAPCPLLGDASSPQGSRCQPGRLRQEDRPWGLAAGEGYTASSGHSQPPCRPFPVTSAGCPQCPPERTPLRAWTPPRPAPLSTSCACRMWRLSFPSRPPTAYYSASEDPEALELWSCFDDQGKSISLMP